MNRFDKDKDGYIRFSDFCDMISPHDPPPYILNIINQKFKSPLEALPLTP